MKKQNSFVSMGIVSLFLVFTVFCMVVLCLLTYSTSRSDLVSSRQSFEKTTAYYEACTQAADLVSEIRENVEELHASVKTEKDFYLEITEILPEKAMFSMDANVISFCIPFSETQELYVELSVSFSTEKEDILFLNCWKTRIVGEWSPDLTQNVYKKGVKE